MTGWRPSLMVDHKSASGRSPSVSITFPGGRQTRVVHALQQVPQGITISLGPRDPIVTGVMDHDYERFLLCGARY